MHVTNNGPTNINYILARYLRIFTEQGITEVTLSNRHQTL